MGITYRLRDAARLKKELEEIAEVLRTEMEIVMGEE